MYLEESEKVFLNKFLCLNNCCMKSAGEMLKNSLSCSTFNFLRSNMDDFNSSQLKEFLSSLLDKKILTLKKRDGDFCKSVDKLEENLFRPDLYCISEKFLMLLDPNLTFKEGLKELGCFLI